MSEPERLMAAAIAVCRTGIEANQAPFGAVIATRDGKIICSAYNTVRKTRDSTAHAEINAIRGACGRLNTIDLSGHVLAATCEPCPMCAAAIHWASLDRVWYGASIADAVNAGFRELPIACQSVYDMGGSRVRVEGGVLRNECKALFDLWRTGPDPTPY